MTEWQGEQDRAVWWELCRVMRQRHESCLGEKPIWLSDRDGYVPPQALLFITQEEIKSIAYPINERADRMELLVRWAREEHALAIGMIFQGVSPEQEAGKVHLRPTIISNVQGVGRFEGWSVEVNQRVDRDGSDLVLQTPLVRRLGPNNAAMEWEAELGSAEVLRGLWPKRVPIWSE